MTAPPSGTPPAEVEVDVELVRELLALQHPDLADRTVVPVGSGWDNTTLRLGDDLAVRLPRRAAAASLVIHEQSVLPRLASRLPLGVPAPVRTGRPALGYPWPWSVVPWFEGTSADRAPVDAGQASVLGRFLAALHTPAATDAPANPFRGGPLADRAGAVTDRLDRLERRGVATAGLRELWQRATAAPAAIGAPIWLHGDLHPGNLLTGGGRLVAVIDWGDVTAGDPATDLATAWLTFDRDAHPAFRAAYGHADDTALWDRAAGWAVAFAAMLLDTGLEDHPAFAAVGARAVTRLTGTAPEVLEVTT